MVVLLCGPIFRWLSWLGDEGFLLHGAVRMLHGQRLYVDFFEFLPPGGFLIVELWMKIFGEGFAAARVLAIGVVALISALLYAAARVASGDRWIALALALVWAVRAPFEVNHHWFTTAASMASALALLLAVGRPDWYPGRHLAAGIFAGAALVTTQSRGALICAAVLVVLLGMSRAVERVAWTALGVIVFPLAAFAYVAFTSSVTLAFDNLIRYPARTYVGTHTLPYGSFTTLADALPVALLPATMLLSIVPWIRAGALARRDRLVVTTLALGIVGLLGAFPRADVAHVMFALPLACPLCALAVKRLVVGLSPRARAVTLGVAAAVVFAHAAYAVVLRIGVVSGPRQTVETARGLTVRRPGVWTDDLASLVGHIRSIPAEEPFFFYPYMPMAPYLTARRHVAAFDMMMPGHTTPEQYRDGCLDVLERAHWVVVDRTWIDPRRLRAVFPELRDARPLETRSFEAALAQGFEVVHRSATFELRRRTTGASRALCEPVAARSAL